MGARRRLQKLVAMARGQDNATDEPVPDSYFQSPEFAKELSGFDREMRAVLVNAKMSRTLDKKAQARAMLLWKWESNTVTQLLPLGKHKRAARIRSLTIEAFRCPNFVKTCDYLEISKTDMMALGRRISAALP